MTESRLTNSPAETIRFGEEFGARYIQPGVVVTLRGELGAGKTHFVKGIAGSLGIEESELTSPTFALANEYEGWKDGETITLFHLDCYRFEKPEELLELGVEDYLYPQRGATIIEWPERIEPLIPVTVINVQIEVISETERLFTITTP